MLVQLISLFLVSVVVSKKQCPSVLTVDITDGNLHSDGTISKDGIFYNKTNYYHEQDGTIRGCICNITNCIRKCCQMGQNMVNKTCVSQKGNFSYDVYNGTQKLENDFDFHMIYNFNCPHNWSPLIPDFSVSSHSDNFYIQENGSIYLPNFDDNIKILKPHEYCIDIISDIYQNNTFSGLICLNSEELETTSISAGMIISMPFLLATFIAYALLPDRNLHMKALMFYVIDLMFSYLFLVIIQLSNGKFSAKSCTALGYLCLFFFLASFFWMNVICIDIWFAFSGLRGFSGSKKSAERKRFYIYCAYASITPIVLILIIYSISALSETHSWYNPAIGEGQCFLRRGYPELLYFYGPMAIIITINITFFVITAIKIRRVKKDTSMLKKEDSKRHSYENDKQNFNLYLKLLFAMGVNWSMEVISWAVGWAVGKAPDAIWYLSDFCNAIYGVFIFFIFVFKKNIWKLLKKRYYSFIGRPHLAHSLSSQNTTRTTSGYSTATALHDNPNGTGLNDTTTLTSEA